MTDTTQTVAIPNVTDEDLRAISSFDDAVALINEKMQGRIIDAGKELGTGFNVAEKDALLGLGFIVLTANRNTDTTTGRAFWSLTVVTKDSRKVIINDGGTGIAAQCDALDARMPDGFVPMLVAGGLRKSTYNHPEHGISTTYYLATVEADKV